MFQHNCFFIGNKSQFIAIQIVSSQEPADIFLINISHIPALFCLLIIVVRIHNSKCSYLPLSGIITLFSLAASPLQRTISGLFHIYEVLTAPRGRLSGSNITLDLPAHKRNTHQTTQTHRWSPYQQPVIMFFNYRYTQKRLLLSCHLYATPGKAREE